MQNFLFFFQVYITDIQLSVTNATNTNIDDILKIKALTNHFLSNVCSRIPVLQYLFINILPFDIKIFARVDEAESILQVFNKQCFLSQPQYAYGLCNFSLLLYLQYAWNSRIYIKEGTPTFVWRPRISCTVTLSHLPKRYKTIAIFLVKIYYLFNSLLLV